MGIKETVDETVARLQPFTGALKALYVKLEESRKESHELRQELLAANEKLEQAQASLAAARAQALEPFEQLVIDMRAIGKMLGEHQLASVCEDYARRAAAASAHWKCKASAANTGANDPQDCDWPTCGCDPSDPALAKLFAKERLAELNLIPQSEHWSTGLEGYIMRRKDTLAARVAELKGRKDSV